MTDHSDWPEMPEFLKRTGKPKAEPREFSEEVQAKRRAKAIAKECASLQTKWRRLRAKERRKKVHKS